MNENQYIKHIAKRLNVSQQTITRLLIKYDLYKKTKPQRKLVKPKKEDLETSYIDERKSIPKLANEYHVGNSTIHRWLRSYNIKIRDRTSAQLKDGAFKPTKDQLEHWYLRENKTLEEIAQICGIYGGSSVRLWLIKYRIPFRNDHSKENLEVILTQYAQQNETR